MAKKTPRNPLVHYIQPPTEKYPHPRNHSPSESWTKSALGKKTIAEQGWVLAKDYKPSKPKD